MNNTLAQLMDVATIIDKEMAQTGGELTPEIEQMLGLTEALTEQKVDATEYIISRLNAESDFLKKRAAEFTAAAKARANAADRIKERVKQLMLIHERSEISGEYVRFVVSPTTPSLIIDSEMALPEKYKKLIAVAEIDRAGIKKDLQDGTPVEGAHLQESFGLRTYPISGTKKVSGK